MSQLPFVSIIIPTYDAKALEKCLDSLMDQNYPKERTEIIVVDSSKDNLAEKFQKYNVKFFHKPELNSPGKARNFGVKMATGSIMAFIDSDCIARKDWLSKIVDDFSEFPEIVGVLGFYNGGKNGIERIVNKEFVVNKKEIGQFDGFVEGNSAFKREIFDEGNVFGELKYYEGNILAIQLKARGYRTLKDYSLRVYHLGFTWTLRKMFHIGCSHYYVSKKYWNDFNKESLFSLLVISSLIMMPLSFIEPLLLLPFIFVNCVFGYYSLKTLYPIHLHVIKVLPVLILMRWILWFGFFREWIVKRNK